MANEFLYQRGARRSAAPQYAPWTAPQSAADISAQALARILRQPQQAQQASDQRLQQRSTEDTVGAPAMQSGPGPAQLTQLLQQLTSDGNINVDGPSDNQSTGAIHFNESAGPMNPALGRVLRALTVAGVSSINPFAGVLANSVINNPESETGVATNLAMGGLRRAVPQVGVLDTLRQLFGADSLTKTVDQSLQSLTAPAAANPGQETQAPAPVSDSIGTPVDPTQWAGDPETIQQLLDQFYNYNINTGQSGDSESFGGTNQSAGGTTDHGEGDGGATRTA